MEVDRAIIASNAALRADRAFTASHEAGDTDALRCDHLVMIAYSTRATSPAGIAAQVGLALETEGRLLDPAIRTLLEAIRDASNAMNP